jgi:beta-fructofuranosidase
MIQNSIRVSLALLMITVTFAEGGGHSTEAEQQRIDKAVAAIEAAVPNAARDSTRPIYHFRPPALWMNDVCGAFYYQGYYHVFFQQGPLSDGHNRGRGIGWGHTRSRNLVQWEFLRPALMPPREARMEASGSAFIRKSGRPILFFAHTPMDLSKNKRQQWAAVPVDEDLIVWRRINIGLEAGKSGVPRDIKANWADMFVFQVGDRVFATFKESEGLICEAQNNQLTAWQAVGKVKGVDGECPNLFSLDERQVLIRSTYPISYMIGEFDPQAITLDLKTSPRVLDYGYGGEVMPSPLRRGLYGTTVFSDPHGRTILLGWVSGFKSDRGWNGCMSLPRLLSLDPDDRLIQTPAPELEQLRGEHLKVEKLSLKDELKIIGGARGDALEIKAEFVPGDANAFGLKVRCSEDGQRGILLRYSDGILNVGGAEVPLPLRDSSCTLRMHLFLDKSVLEVFIDEGRSTVTQVNYTEEEDLGICVFAENGSAVLASLDVWSMNSIW